ncbi:MAG: hypothetical protein AAFN74_19380, partial [Myxococcota bacterium]
GCESVGSADHSIQVGDPMKPTTLAWTMLAVFALASSPASAKKKKKGEEIDFVDLATVLVRDGNYQRASGVLAQVDTTDESLDRARFHLLRGLVRLNLSLFSQAAEDFEASLAAGQTAPIVPIYLGQAYFYSKQYEKSLEAFSKSEQKASEIPTTFAMRAEASWKLERYEQSWAILNAGLERHPTYDELLRRKAFYAIGRRLYGVAAELGRAYLARTEAKYQDYLAIGTALYRSGSVEESLRFLELARLRYPDEVPVTVELARVYKERGKYITAGALLERAALKTGEDALVVEAGELFRQADDHFRALALNSRIADSEKRLRQRLSVLVELRRYELVATMDRSLERVGLLKDESIRYALAYAHFKIKNYARAEELLSGLRDPEIFRQATELRKAMVDCREQQWRC